jgi:hypothetical protein
MMEGVRTMNIESMAWDGVERRRRLSEGVINSASDRAVLTHRLAEAKGCSRAEAAQEIDGWFNAFAALGLSAEATAWAIDHDFKRFGPAIALASVPNAPDVVNTPRAPEVPTPSVGSDGDPVVQFSNLVEAERMADPSIANDLAEAIKRATTKHPEVATARNRALAARD